VEKPVQVVCPTHGRADNVMTFEALPIEDVVLSVTESQVDEYRAAYPDATIDPHSDEIQGLLAKKAYLYEKHGNVFFVDDDVLPMVDLTGAGPSRVPQKTALEIVYRLADQAMQMGTYLFGFNEDAVPMHFAPQDPFSLSGPVAGTCQGILEGSGLWWPEVRKFGSADDVWISGLNAYENRTILRDDRYCLRDVRGFAGGLATLRNRQTQAETAEFLRQSFGEAIVLKDPEQATFYYWRLSVPW
jgi:hypothetical protein